MATPPPNPHTRTAKPSTKFRALIGNEQGDPPGEESEDPTFIPLRIERSAGGQTLDSCVFSVDLGTRGERLVDMITPTGWNREIEVRIPSTEPKREEDTYDRSDRVFLGSLGIQSLRLGPRDEAATITARVEPRTFGRPLTGINVYDKLTDAIQLLEYDAFFNPLLDGQIVPNASAHLFGTDDCNAWAHPESLRTTAAKTWQGESGVTSWTLARMVRSVCWMLNPDEDDIKNPTADDVAADITAHDPPEIVNFWLRRGLYLPACLDAILTPHGFGWFLKVGMDEDGFTFRKIRIFKRGVGEIKRVYWQRPDEELDLAKQNTLELDHDLNIADIANSVEGYGAFEEREVTIQLFRGWPSSQDTLTPDDLDKTVTTAYNPPNPYAWRRFVANEGGDHNGLRTEITDPIDFTGVFSKFVVRRRPIGDCLQLDANGRRKPPIVEWYNTEEEAWQLVAAGSYTVMTDQIGIMFNGSKPPDEIAAMGASDSDVVLRITGTITGDARLARTADRRDESPNGADVVLTLDVSDRFFDRHVQTLAFASQHNAAEAYGADTRNDGDDLQAYVDEARNVEDAAQLSLSLPLHGIHREYEIGDLLAELSGRNISFNRLADDQEEKRYPQIVGIEYDTQRQMTILHVEMNRDEGYERDGSFGGPTGKRWRRRQ